MNVSKLDIKNLYIRNQKLIWNGGRMVNVSFSEFITIHYVTDNTIIKLNKNEIYLTSHYSSNFAYRYQVI